MKLSLVQKRNFKTLSENNKKLKEKLYRENRGKKSLEELAVGKSKTVQRLINDATEDVLKCFENISENRKCEQ